MQDIRMENNRYSVKLPFKPNHPEIPDNYNLCKQRLLSLKKSKLDKDVQFRNDYDKIIKDQLADSVIQEVYDTG